MKVFLFIIFFLIIISIIILINLESISKSLGEPEKLILINLKNWIIKFLKGLKRFLKVIMDFLEKKIKEIEIRIKKEFLYNNVLQVQKEFFQFLTYAKLPSQYALDLLENNIHVDPISILPFRYKITVPLTSADKVIDTTNISIMLKPKLQKRLIEYYYHLWYNGLQNASYLIAQRGLKIINVYQPIPGYITIEVELNE